MDNAQNTRRYNVASMPTGGYVVLEHGTIDGIGYAIIAAGLFGTLAEAVAECRRLTDLLLDLVAA